MKRSTILLLTGLVFTSCQPIEYGNVQHQFENAVQVDNSRIGSPFTDGTPDYSRVLEKLTPAYIAKLDPRLQPNAWALRGISAWRSGNWSAARDASTRGLKLAHTAGSRDDVLLTMLPGLVFESETLARWAAAPDRNETAYNTAFRADMVSSWAQLTLAEGTLNATTPNSTKYYLYYQKWRIAMNWAQIILDAGQGDMSKTTAMNEWVKQEGGVGMFLHAAAREAKKEIKGPLNALIEAQE